MWLRMLALVLALGLTATGEPGACTVPPRRAANAGALPLKPSPPFLMACPRAGLAQQCTDTPPGSTLSCQEQKQLGKCDR